MTRLDRTEATFETSSARLPGGVVLPSRLNDALASDNLAVFVGAGASVELPAALPLFRGMTETVLGLGGSVDLPAEDGRFDVQLGDLADAGFDVRGAVRRIIDVVGSAPNRWHSALTGLWPEPPLIRIVTTNYDVHLEGTAGSLAASWSAPALPLGHCFTGIVHLHGSLAGADEDFVITDRDFGRAYLTEGWARRFLVGLFQRYVVLFVGYSHSDFVMQYLARGLPPDSQARYALVKPDEDPAKWERLRITPISWEDESGDPYGPAVTALREWGKRTRWTHLEHDDHIQSVVAGGPSVNSVEDSYLTRALEDEAMTTIFCRHTSGESWLTWIAAKPAFRALFDRNANLSPSQMHLARWFAEEHAIKGDGAALRALAEAGGTLSTGLWYAIADTIWRQRPVQPGEFQAWVTVLIDQIHKRDDSLLSYLATECILPDDHQPLMALLRALFEPRLRLRPGFAFPGHVARVAPAIDVLANSHWMAEILEKLLKPAIETVAEDVFEIATSSLMKYNDIYRSFGQGTDSYDPMSLRRSAIEPHEQDPHNDGALFAVDLAREAAVALARVHGLSEVANRLLARRVPLLTRIAVWVVGEGDPSGS